MSRPGARGPIVILKHGGTSLGTAARVRRAASRIAHLARRRANVVAVVSARGDTTDRILRDVDAVSAAGVRGGEEPDAPHGRPVRVDARAAREVDRALATGEDLSAALLAASLASLGVNARSLRGGEAGILAAGAHGSGGIVRVESRPILQLLSRGIVPVVSGFQGRAGNGETLTLGRGGSDTSAVALAVALLRATGGPVTCEIVTDVDGVHDRDPRRDRGARRIPSLSPSSLVAMAEAGSRVVHLEAARLAERHGVPLRVYSYRAPFDAERTGTLIADALEEGAA